jgi:phosphoribosylformimino-5-aminoimidazole carboxamide ribotide isomerase
MITWAAVDVIDDRAVRLNQGREEALTDYGPAREAVRRWVDLGLSRFHLVDLGAAFGRESNLMALVKGCLRRFPGINLRVSGGIRSTREIRRLLDAGAHSVVLGSLPFENPDEAAKAVSRLGAGRAVAALDLKENRVRTHGWLRDSGFALDEAYIHIRDLGFTRALVTDVQRDGLMTGPNLELYRDMVCSGLEVVAAGGIRCRGDLDTLRAIPSVKEAVTGKALYEGSIRPEEIA